MNPVGPSQGPTTTGPTTSTAAPASTTMTTAAAPAAAPQPVDYGDWFAGGTLVVAIIVLILDLITRRKQAALDLKRQAARVVARVDLVETEDPSPWGGTIGRSTAGKVFVQNTSEEPVFACLVTVRFNPEIVEEHRHRGWPAFDEKIYHYQTIPPGVTPIQGLTLTPRDLEKNKVQLEFTDSAGVRWRRGFGGLPLERLPAPEHRRWWPPFRRQRNQPADTSPAAQPSPTRVGDEAEPAEPRGRPEPEETNGTGDGSQQGGSGP